MSPKISRAVTKELQSEGKSGGDTLTSRETEILTFIEQGHTYQEIADSLTISRHTVHSHIKNIYDKLHTGSRSAAIRKARKKAIL